MRGRRRRCKEVIRNKVISLRLNDEEFHRLKANGLREKQPLSLLLRARMSDLIEGMPVRTEAVPLAQVG